MSDWSLKVDSDSHQVVLSAENNHFVLPALWLRERCTSEELVDSLTGQRFFNPHELPDDIDVIALTQRGANTFQLKFSDGVEDCFDLDRLISELVPVSKIPDPKLWKSDIDFPIFDWGHIDQPDYTLQALTSFFENGFIVIGNTPVERESILSIAGQFGYVRKTNFGEYFEVYSRSDANDLAYTSSALAAHTDNPYRDPVPGIQFLHCLVNDNPGGLSTLVDGLSVCRQLQNENQEGFDLLCRVSVRFQFAEKDFEIVDSHPLICTNEQGEVTAIHYSPRLDYMPLMDPKTTRDYQKARRRLGQLFADPEFAIRFPLKQGEVMMFDNNRVLHGRTAFDASKGARHLQGCYIDRDNPKSLFTSISARMFY